MITNNPNPKNMKSEEQPSHGKINPFKESVPHEKINPFKELPKPHPPHPDNDNHPHHSSPSPAQDSAGKASKEITITLKPWKLVKGLFIVLVLLTVFLAGRWSTGASSFSLPDFSSVFSHEASPSGLVTGDIQVNDSAVKNATELAPAPANESVPVAAPQNDSKNEDDGKVIEGAYSRVSLSLDGVYKDWKGTWGKIKGVKYTIINHEDGTIKPHHFVMTVDGYNDHGEKNFDVSYTSQKVKAGQTLSDEAAVTGGFAYSQTQIPNGDLKKVKVSLYLLDQDGITMASTEQLVDLSGD